jgi:hypothetical protein
MERIPDGAKPKVYADFQNADEQGRLRLNCVGTLVDLSRQGIELSVGRSLILYSEDLEVAGVVEYSEAERIWVGRIDWEEIWERPEISCQVRFALGY